MTGNDIRNLRETLGISHTMMAEIVGLHHSSIYRWESYGDNDLKLSEHSLRVLTVMNETLMRGEENKARELGEKIVKAHVVKGPLYALYQLLEEFYAHHIR